VTLQDCQKFLQDLSSYYRFRRARVKYPRNTIKASFNGHVVQIDLADYVRNIEYNNDYRFIFVATDTWSKWLVCLPIRNKSAESIISALEDLIEDLPFPIINIYSDKEAGLLSKKCTQFLKEQDINLYTTKSIVKASQAENSIRSLRIATAKYFELTKSQRWFDFINFYTLAYNDTTHSTTKQKPLDLVSDPLILLDDTDLPEQSAAKTIKENTLPPIGSYVRLSKIRTNFEKESTGTFTREIFKVIGHKLGQKLPMVSIEDLKGKPVDGAFYTFEIYPVSFEAFQEVISASNDK